ncbi:MAG: hypothetical protein OXG09_07670 [Chloroflexi bacterium]|nr:hypothetical protein [Chloroflexota bacterium]
MYGRIPSLYEANFWVSYYLPALGFTLLAYRLLARFQHLPSWLPDWFHSLTVRGDLWGLEIAAAIALAIAILLTKVHRSVLAFLKGEGRFNPWRLVGRIEHINHQQLLHEVDLLEERMAAYQAQGETPPLDFLKQRMRTLLFAEQRYPERHLRLQPTAFGNVLRAFEAYPRIVYNMDGLSIWSRLLAVLPNAVIDRLDRAKSQVDFWLNVWILSLVILLSYAANTLLSLRIHWEWLPVLLIGLALHSSWQARMAAVDWGHHVKAAFDVYRHELRRLSGYGAPRDPAAEREFWGQYSEAVMFRHPSMPAEDPAPEE